MDQNALLGLAAGKIEEKIAPVRDAAQRVRMALVAWEEIEKEECERAITSAITKALGVEEESEPSPSLALARVALAEAIAALPLGEEAGPGPGAGAAPAPEGVHIDPASGNDATGDGTKERPFKTWRMASTRMPAIVRDETPLATITSEGSGYSKTEGAGEAEPTTDVGRARTREARLEPPSVVVRETRDPTGEEWARAEELLKEIEAVDRDAKAMHVLRLTPLLQAIVAEIRLLSEPWSPSHALHDRLTKKLGVLGAIRKSAGVRKYIEGLAFGSTGDWATIARACRRRVEAFDRDAEAPASSEKKSKPRAVPPLAKELADIAFGAGSETTHTASRRPEHPPSPGLAPGVFQGSIADCVYCMAEPPLEGPDLPRLRALGLPIVVGGGRPLPEGQCEELGKKLGFVIEHHPIDHANPKAEQALVARVKSGKVGAVILIEGFMKHSTFSSIVKTCTVRGVPYAYAGKGKSEAIEAGCAEVERKLSAGPPAGVRRVSR